MLHFADFILDGRSEAIGEDVVDLLLVEVFPVFLRIGNGQHIPCTDLQRIVKLFSVGRFPEQATGSKSAFQLILCDQDIKIIEREFAFSTEFLFDQVGIDIMRTRTTALTTWKMVDLPDPLRC